MAAGAGEHQEQLQDALQPEDFAYHKDEFILEGVAWPGTAPSRFDRALLGAWQERMARGLFRYHLAELPTRVLPGAMRLLVQLNAQRSTERRRPQAVRSLTQPFDSQQFNFTQIRPGEVLLRLRRRPVAESDLAAADHALVVINVSPLERGHVLLLPEPTLRLPQILTPELLRVGLEAVLLSAQPGFRVGFNSLGASASVNHLHLHGFYLAHPLLVETAPAEPLCPTRGLNLLLEAPAPALLFYTAGSGLEALARDACRAAARLLALGLAYNVFVTRGAPPEGSVGPGPGAGLRLLLWARRPHFEVEESAAFNVALCELAGFLPVATAAAFEELSEAEALRAIRRPLLPEPEMRRLAADLALLLED
ncbi:GDP-D-glucose phosphorylase 1 [Centrocercus urophasianus]|uniref:GDP-D-glucose phosphorylase 1 n=1 Tax=Centrocercus urophasianus TaxID=9002 RepID=UPI001C651E31|nr:GDP-D-glucose phosphorylase 1 [Centrocercus urophasianus]